MTQLLGAKGLSGYIDGKIALPTQTPTGTATTHSTPIYSTTPTADEWHFRDQLTRGHITLNCTNVTGLGVKTMGTAKEAWDSIQTEWGTSTDMWRSHAQELLNQTTYTEGASVQEHIKLLRTRKAAVDNLSTTAMNDETWRGIIIRSIPPTPRWLLVIPPLYTLISPADIVSILLAHGMILDRGHGNQPTSNSSDTALAVQGMEECANPNCKAKIRSTHTTANCYWPGGGKEGQFPSNFGQRSKANSASSSSHETTQHFALSAWISNQHETRYTVSETLIEDPDERSHHTTSPTTGDNIPLFDTLDNIHTFNDSSDAAVPDIRDPLTPDFTPTSVKTHTRTSTDGSGDENPQDIEGNTTSTPDEVEARNGNVLVGGRRTKLNQADGDDNQPIPQPTDPEPKEQVAEDDNQPISDRTTTPHTEEDSTEVKICKPTDGNNPIPTKNNTHLTDSFLEGGAGHKTAVTPGTDEIPNEKLLLAQPDEQGENRAMRDAKGDPKFPDEKPEGRHKVNSEEGRHKVCPSTADDAKSILDNTKPIWHSYAVQIPSAKLILRLANKDQHLSDVVKIATMKDLPLMDTTLTNGPLEGPPRISSDQSRGGGGVYWSISRKYREAQFSDNPRPRDEEEDEEQREVNPKEGDHAESNPRKGDDAKSNPREGDDAKSNHLPPIRNHPDFDDAEPIAMPMDQNAILLKGQHHPSLAEITKMENLPYPMGTKLKIPPTTAMTAEFLEQHPRISDEHSDAAFTTATDVITPERLKDPGGTHSTAAQTAAKRVFRDLRGTRRISFGRKSENNHLQHFGGARKASQHKKWGCIPMLDERAVPWINPREQDLSTRSTKAKVSTTSTRISPHGPSNPFGKYSHHHLKSTYLLCHTSTERGGETGNNLTDDSLVTTAMTTTHPRSTITQIPPTMVDRVLPYAFLHGFFDRHMFDNNATVYGPTGDIISYNCSHKL